jgi:hypothetical protein
VSTIPAALNPRSPEFDSDLYLSQIQDIGGVPDFDSVYAETCAVLWNRGETKAAFALDECGRKRAGDKYACSYVDNLAVIHCHNPVCVACATYIAKKRTERIIKGAGNIAEIAPDFYITWVEIHVPCHPIPEAVKAQIEEAKQSLLSLFPGAQEAYNSKHCVNMLSHFKSALIRREILSNFAGFADSGHAVIRLMTYGADNLQARHGDIRAAFPYASHIVVSTPKIECLAQFAAFLTAPVIPADPEARADMFQALRGVRRFDYMGQTQRRHRAETAAFPQGKELYNEVQENAETMLSQDPAVALSPQSPPPEKCPHCGASHVGRVVLPGSLTISNPHPQRK